MKRVVPFLCLAATFLGTASAQWPAFRDPGVPLTRDGQPNLAAPAPRLGGHPDLTGVWEARRTPLGEYPPPVLQRLTTLQVDYEDITKEYLNIFWGVPPDRQPVRPETAAIVKRFNDNGEDTQTAQCLPASIPGSLMVLVFKMIQAPRETVMLFDNGDPARQIFTDGRPLPVDPQPSWMGYSVGKWEGDSFVVESSGFNDRATLDGSGYPRSEQMRMIERYRRRDFGHMDLEVTITDPKYYTGPINLKLSLTLQPQTDIFEYVCNENEKDQAHIR